MLSLRRISVSFDGKSVLKDISLTIEKGERVAIIGPSGAGKSTLIKTMNGLVRPDEGEVVFEGLTLNERNAGAIRQKETMVFQQFELFPHLSVIDNITLAPLTLHKCGPKEAHAKALALLGEVGLADKAYARPNSLSGGQKQRVAIARALALDPEMVLFDEPTSALDPEMVKEVLDVIGGLAQKGLTLVIVTHEMGFARQIASRVLFLDEARIVEDGKPEEVLGQPKEKRVRDFLAKVMPN